MASAKLRKKANNDKFLSPEQTRTIKPADFKNHAKVGNVNTFQCSECLCVYIVINVCSNFLYTLQKNPKYIQT